MIAEFEGCNHYVKYSVKRSAIFGNSKDMITIPLATNSYGIIKNDLHKVE